MVFTTGYCDQRENYTVFQHKNKERVFRSLFYKMRGPQLWESETRSDDLPLKEPQFSQSERLIPGEFYISSLELTSAKGYTTAGLFLTSGSLRIASTLDSHCAPF